MDLSIKTLSGDMKHIPDNIIEAWKKDIQGMFLMKNDPGYDEARRVWNGMIDKHPALIIRAQDVKDMQSVIRFAAEHELLIAIKSGGHSLPGHSTCDDGLMLDLSMLKKITVNAEHKTAEAEPGVLWGEMDRATQEYGLAVTGGQISHTGIAGLTVGAGLGWLMRKHGLTCDNLIEAEVVLADGSIVTASKNQNPDLFWAIRGGGGNFGIISKFTYQLHSLEPILGGILVYPLPAAKAVIQQYREYIKNCPRELSTTGVMLTSPDGHPAFAIGVAHFGPLEAGQKIVEEFKKFGPVVMEQIGPMPYSALQSMMDHVAVPGLRYYMKANFFQELNDELIDIFIDSYQKAPSPGSAILLVHMEGAMQEMDAGSTAFPHRNSNFSYSVFTGWQNPADDQKNIDWCREIFDKTKPLMKGGVYVNEMVDEGEERIKEAYGASYDRLLEIKKKYDPKNLFRLNQNIK